MIFLVHYDRANGKIITLQEFRTEAKAEANEERLRLELSLHDQGVLHEVVILEADDEKALRATHQRYFESVRSIAQSQPTG